jgi:hypothetical protein
MVVLDRKRQRRRRARRAYAPLGATGRYESRPHWADPPPVRYARLLLPVLVLPLMVAVIWFVSRGSMETVRVADSAEPRTEQPNAIGFSSGLLGERTAAARRLAAVSDQRKAATPRKAAPSRKVSSARRAGRVERKPTRTQRTRPQQTAVVASATADASVSDEPEVPATEPTTYTSTRTTRPARSQTPRVTKKPAKPAKRPRPKETAPPIVVIIDPPETDESGTPPGDATEP